MPNETEDLEDLDEVKPIDVWNERFASSVEYPYCVDGIQFETRADFVKEIRKRDAAKKRG